MLRYYYYYYFSPDQKKNQILIKMICLNFIRLYLLMAINDLIIIIIIIINEISLNYLYKKIQKFIIRKINNNNNTICIVILLLLLTLCTYLKVSLLNANVINPVKVSFRSQQRLPSAAVCLSQAKQPDFMQITHSHCWCRTQA